MNHPEAYIASYYERVLGYSTVANVRYPGPSRRNWSDLDLVAMPLPPLDKGGNPRPAHIVQVKWRAKYLLGEGNEEWLDQSVINTVDVHREASRLLGAWKYQIVLVTTRVWLTGIDRTALQARLDQSAREASTSCTGALLRTFEDIAEEWTLSMGSAVKGWAEDPFSFLLQVHQLGQTPPPAPLPLPAVPHLAENDSRAVLSYDPDVSPAQDQEAVQRWFDTLLALQEYQVLGKAPYREGSWKGISARVRGGVWIFFGRTGAIGGPSLSVWFDKTEALRMEIVGESDIRKATIRLLVTMWS